ncbi:MAG TPA: hypothetical protein VN785_12280 [Candidatus Angelobacter sp.]|nr:hypothetical protein [Candidatus Angelobacter sp.]
MKKVLFVLMLVLFCCTQSRAQQIPSPSTNVSTQQLTLLPQTPLSVVTTMNASPSIQGATTYYYWFVSNGGGVVSPPAGPFPVFNAPATLGGINTITLNWNPAPGVTTYDVLRTTTTAVPTGACGCAVATALTLTQLVDSSPTTSAYTVSTTLSQIPLVLTNLSSLAGVPPTIVVDGVTVTTVAQALAKLNGNGGVIDARGCTPGSLNLGTFDIGNPSIFPVTLLLGPCTYNFTSIVEEPQLHVIGLGSDGGTFLNYTGPSNVFMFPHNTQGHDLTSMIFTGLSVGNFGSSTNVGCMDLTPSQTNTSSAQNLIFDNLFDTVEASPPACLVLHGTAAGLTGENEVINTTITDNTFFWSGTPISLLGSVGGVIISANTTDTTGVAVSCNATGGVAIGISITANDFFTTTTPISNTGCGITASANVDSTGLKVPDTINGNPTVSQTGGATPGHLATFGLSGLIQDGGTLPTAIQSEFFSTLSADIPLTANTVTTILTQAVTMPSSGCPCRADIRYHMLSTIDNQTLDATVSDGTNNFATSQTETTSTAPTGQTGAQVTNVTYANSQNVTFTLKAETSGVSTTVKAAPQQLGQNTFLSITILTSN